MAMATDTALDFALLAKELRALVRALEPRAHERELGGGKLVPTSVSFSTAQLQATAAGQPGGAGIRLGLTGRSVLLMAGISDATALIEVAFDRQPTDQRSSSTSGATGWTQATSWVPMVPGVSVKAPGGTIFKELWVRAATGCSNASTRNVCLVADVSQDAQDVSQAARTGNINANGDQTTSLSIVGRPSGTTDTIEGADGTAAGFGVPAIAAAQEGGAGYLRLLGGPGDALPSAVLGAQRIVEATTPTATVTRPTAGAASAAALAANAARRGAVILNLSTTETVYINFGATAAATATGFPIAPGGFYVLTTRQAVNAIRGAAADVSLAIAEESFT
jgi:hypothetical protein